MQLLWDACCISVQKGQLDLELAGRAAGAVEGWRGPFSAPRGGQGWRQCSGVTQAEEGRGSWGCLGEFSLTAVHPKEQSVCRMGPGLQTLFTAPLLSCHLRERLLAKSSQAALCWHLRLSLCGCPSVDLSKTSELSRIQYQRERPAAAEQCRMGPSQLPWNCRSFTLLQKMLKLAVFWAPFLSSLGSA